MASAEYNFTIEQGTTFTRTLALTDVNGAVLNLTGYTARGQMRETCTSNAIAATLTLIVQTPPTLGKIDMSLTAAETAAIPVGTARSAKRVAKDYVYDIELIRPDGVVIRALGGIASVSPEVTK